MRRFVALLVGSMVVLAASPLPAGAVPAPPADDGVLVSQQATLTTANRLPGQPADPAFALAGAEVRVEALGSPPAYFVTGSTVTLAAEPLGTAYVELGFGNRSAAACVVDRWFTEVVAEYDDPVVSFTGYEERNTPWDCVVARTASIDTRDSDADVLVGALTDTYQRPRLVVGKVTLLGAKQQRLRLVRGAPTKVAVTVRNTGPVAARHVEVTGKGRKIAVRKAVIDHIAPGRSATVTLTVTLKAEKPRRLRLRAAGGGVAASRSIGVRRIKPPARPKPGTYRNKAGTVGFTIRKGRIVGWHGRMQTRCGGYGSIPTYTMNTYDFRRVRIGRNGIVQASQRGTDYGAHLQLKAVGRKVTKGRFDYTGPGGCSAFLRFGAHRVGR